MSKPQSLTLKQKLFVEHYLQCWNATEAARQAGYSEKSIRSIASENLTKPNIRAEIDRRMKLLVMSADEAMLRLTQQASSNIGDFIGWTEEAKPFLDLKKADALGRLHLVKKLKWGQYGPEIELYDKQAAAMFIVKQERGDKLSLQLDAETIQLAEKMGASIDGIMERLTAMIRKQAENKGLI